jgi:molybdate transport system substrate-binding protein
VKATALATLIAAAGIFAGPPASAADIALLAAGASKETVSELIPSFEKTTGHKVIATWAPAPEIRKRLVDGETYDLVISRADDIDGFVKQGKVTPDSRTDLMKTGVGMAVRAGAPRPDVGSTESLKRALLAARTIGRSAGSSGEYVVTLFARLGLSDQLMPRLKQVPPGKQVADMLMAGDVEFGIQQSSELIHAPGIDYLGPLPRELQKTTTYAAGLLGTTKQPDGVKALMKLLTGPEAVPIIKRNGMEPG